MITLCLYLITLPLNYSKITSVFLLNLILIILFIITYVIGILFIIALNLYNTRKKWYVNLYDSILDILLELFDDPLHTDEGLSTGVEDLEPSGEPEYPEGAPKGSDGDPEGDPEDDPEKNDKKRKRSEDSEDDSEEDSNKQKKGKLDKGKGRADPDDISDDDYDYRDVKNSEDEQNFYDYQNSDEDDDNTYLAESLDRRDELEKKLEGASPEEKERILNEIEVLTDLINNLLN